MPCDFVSDCYYYSDSINGRNFNVIYFIGTREKFDQKTGYYPSKDSKGVGGCIDKGKRILYLLLDDDMW